MWFGDLVTMRWFNDLWLNESFATYMAYVSMDRATRFKEAWLDFATKMKARAKAQDQLPTTHPIVADIPDVDAVHLNFDSITYEKGASVLKQLVAWVGEEAFFKGINLYFRRLEYGNSELPDFLGPLEEASGRDLRTWARLWLEQAGVNTIGAEYELEGGRIRRRAAPDRGSLASDAPPAPASGRAVRPPWLRAEAASVVELDVDGELTPVPELG
jgi:aminopeptidase N